MDALHHRVAEGELFASLEQHFRIRNRVDRVGKMEIVNLLIDLSPTVQANNPSRTTALNPLRPDMPSSLPEASFGARSWPECDPRVHA